MKITSDEFDGSLIGHSGKLVAILNRTYFPGFSWNDFLCIDLKEFLYVEHVHVDCGLDSGVV